MSEVLARNNVNLFGEGQPMLFAHGFGCDQNMWRFVTPAFKDHYKIVLFDYVGSGKSDIKAYNKEKYNDLNGYVNDVLDVIDALNLRNIIFVGHSVSCMIGLLAAVKRPTRFDKMIFVGPSARYINDAPAYTGGFEQKDIYELLETMEKNYIGWANFLAPAIMKNSDKPALGEELTNSFCSTDPIVARQFAEVTFLSDNRPDLSKLTIPSLILQCSDDLIAPLEVGDYLNKNIKGSTLKIMKATGHCPHMSAPAETINLITSYLFNAN
ncbi:MAG: alpha/beta hydrolase [Bacteroidota bacterium]|nr:alpha/beta hydrolase [Bacteroidota bacterium]